MSGRVEESMFRRTATGREAMAPAGETSQHVHYQPLRRAGIGKITSKKGVDRDFYYYLSLTLAGAGGDPSKALVPFCTPAQAKELHEKGLIK